jgi:hypothetical protein
MLAKFIEYQLVATEDIKYTVPFKIEEYKMSDTKASPPSCDEKTHTPDWAPP